MNTLQLSLVLVASIWAAMNTLIAGYNAVNGTRDRIVTGCTDEGISLTISHRLVMYRNDWLPLKAGLAAVSIMFAGFILFLPELAENPAVLRPVCYIAALLPFGTSLSFFVLGLRDRRLILDILTAAEAETKKSSPDS